MVLLSHEQKEWLEETHQHIDHELKEKIEPCPEIWAPSEIWMHEEQNERFWVFRIQTIIDREALELHIPEQLIPNVWHLWMERREFLGRCKYLCFKNHIRFIINFYFFYSCPIGSQ